MKNLDTNSRGYCQKNRQLSFFKQLTLVSLLLSSPLLFAKEKMTNSQMLKALSPYSTIVTRSPSNFVPSDEVETIPFTPHKLWVDKTFVADDDGVLTGMRDQLRSWKDTEDYAKSWNLRTTGLYNTPEDKAREKMVKSGMLKYADKRLTGEVKNAEEGTTLAAVGKAQQALRPQAEVGMSPNMKFKFKARALQGEAKMIVVNPWLDYETKYSIFQNNLSTAAGKDFKEVGVKAKATYQVTDKRWVASVDKTLTETVNARVSSSQTSNEMAFTGGAEKIVELLYSRGW